MIVAICKTWTFDAAHHLPHLPDGHKCKRPHGHTYALEIELLATPEAEGPYQGMVLDYDRLDERVRPLLNLVDHRCLNEIAGLENPTTEILVAWLARHLVNVLDEHARDLVRVRVYESSSTWAEVRAADQAANQQRDAGWWSRPF